MMAGSGFQRGAPGAAQGLGFRLWEEVEIKCFQFLQNFFADFFEVDIEIFKDLSSHAIGLTQEP